MQKPFAVIAYRKEMAEKCIEAFGLNSELWDAHGVSDPTLGYCYQRIVMIRPHWRLQPTEAIEFDFRIEDWRLKLAFGGHFNSL